MERRDFISMMGGVPFLAKTEGNYRKPQEKGLQDKDGPVTTPAKRLDYTRTLLDKLCADIGPRPTGSAAYMRGARIIKAEMERSLPSVEYDRYTFERWELVDKPEFLLGGQDIEIFPAHGSVGTPPDGVSGVLVKNGNGFMLADSRSGEAKARLSVSSYGRAIPHFQRRSDPPAVPSIGVGRQDVPLFENAVRDGTHCYLKAWTRYIPGDPGLNIVGRLPGRRQDEILFIAHADTVYSSPGANDNTASVIIMLMLAHAAAGKSFDHTLTFVAADGEEYGLLGAENYAKRRAADGTMKNIRYVVNFDSLTYGPNLWINSEENDLKEMIRSIHNDLNLNTKPRFDDRDGFVMDSAAFRPSGAKAMHVNSRGYDEKTLPVYHRPDDYGRDVPLDCAEIGFCVFNEFIRRADKT